MNTKNTSNTDTAIIDRITEGAFLHAMDSCLTDENKEAARKLATAFSRDCLGRGEVADESPLMHVSIGFILGMGEGMNIASTIEKCGK